MVVAMHQITNPRADKSDKKPDKRNKLKLNQLKIDPRKNVKNKTHLVAQEIKFAQALAGNDVHLREKVLKNLRKWLKTRSMSSFPFSNQDFLRLWKGLFYCMWMSDKPLVQEKLAEDLGSLLYCFGYPKVALQFYGAFLEIMNMEWFGIDQWRIDKFMMLVRRVTRQMFKLLHQHEWDIDLIKEFRKQINRTVLNEDQMQLSLTFHFIDLYLEEIAKVTEGKIKKSTITSLIKPFIHLLARTKDSRLLQTIDKQIFANLLQQSDLGRQYQEKFEVWKQFGFPCSSIDDLELVKEEDEEEEKEKDEIQEEKEITNEDNDDNNAEEEIGLDPRAGNVNVVLHELKFNPKKIINCLEKILYYPETNTKNRKKMRHIINIYTKFADNVYPLGIKNIYLPKEESKKLPRINEKIKELESLDNELLTKTRMIKRLNKKQRRNYYKTGGDLMEFYKKVKKIDNTGSNQIGWLEEDISEEKTPTEKPKKLKRKKSVDDDVVSGVISEKKKKKPKKPQSVNIEEVIPQTNGIKKSDDSLSDKMKQKKSNKKKLSENSVFDVSDEWSEPLKDGEIEYFISSNKKKLKEINEQFQNDEKQKLKNPNLVKNPFAKLKDTTVTPKNELRGKNIKKGQLNESTSLPSSEKRVKIMLDKNISQDTNEYLQQLKNSPQLPFDSTKKPVKGLLKPNLMPSPINPYYKRKIGFNSDVE